MTAPASGASAVGVVLSAHGLGRPPAAVPALAWCLAERFLGRVLIGTTVVGVDVPAVGLVQLAGGGKAEVALRQRIGRGARRKKTGPNIFFVSDYTTGPNAHLQGHARERRAIIEGTDGFREGILKPGADQPWHLVSTSKRAA